MRGGSLILWGSINTSSKSTWSKKGKAYNWEKITLEKMDRNQGCELTIFNCCLDSTLSPKRDYKLEIESSCLQSCSGKLNGETQIWKKSRDASLLSPFLKLLPHEKRINKTLFPGGKRIRFVVRYYLLNLVTITQTVRNMREITSTFVWNTMLGGLPSSCFYSFHINETKILFL